MRASLCCTLTLGGGFAAAANVWICLHALRPRLKGMLQQLLRHHTSFAQEEAAARERAAGLTYLLAAKAPEGAVWAQECLVYQVTHVLLEQPGL